VSSRAERERKRKREESSSDANERRRFWIACAVLAVAWALYAALAIKDFSGPLVGPRDTNYFEYLGYHLRAHYTFGLPPDLGFKTDEVGYWQGTSIAYLSWCAERDLFCMLLLKAFGAGPWIQIYCALSPGVGAFGTLLLLRRDVGVTRAALVAFAGSFMAFYAAYKFPYHLNMAALHWGTLSIVCDFLITRRVVRDRPIEAPLLLVRAALMVLTVGLDVGYVAGYPLTFFTVCVVFWLARWAFFARKRGVRVRAYFPESPFVELKRNRILTAVSVAGLLLGFVVYVPFDLALVRGATVYKFGDAGGNFWASWFRLLIPFLPGANPGSRWVTSIFGDAEGVAEYSVGWALLAFAALGVRCAVRARTSERGGGDANHDERWKLASLVPLLVTFFLCFAFHPKSFPTLHLFPWFFFNRVAGRATVFFPLLLALIALSWEPRGLGKPASDAKRALYILFGLAAVETATAYAIVNDYAPARLEPDARAYFDAVRAAKGEALLEWPFCIAGANGVGTTELCPYYGVMSTAYANRRFHQKKVMSFYLSRLHPSQVAPRMELAQLFSPDKPDPHDARRETRCFDDAKWALFDRIYREHDFSGIQLYVDRLPDECVQAFHARYGEPTARATLAGPGRVEFLPRR
jgi:hypothetical protein